MRAYFAAITPAVFRRHNGNAAAIAAFANALGTIAAIAAGDRRRKEYFRYYGRPYEAPPYAYYVPRHRNYDFNMKRPERTNWAELCDRLRRRRERR
ncbi:MAG: hypothetical protein WD073_10365 [Xanthobacteraceae bacterium]